MKKYLTKRVFTALFSLIGAFALLALLYGRFVIIEKDFFAHGEVAFVVRSYEGNRRAYATEEEARLVRDWLTTLTKTDGEYEDGFVFLGAPQIRIKTDASTVFFEHYGDGIILVTVDTDFFQSGMDKWVWAKSGDAELTKRVFEMCYGAVDKVSHSFDPVWYE